MTLLLVPPSRRGNDVAISLRGSSRDPGVADLIACEAMGASCQADKADRVRSAILHSGRYDCQVSPCVVSSRNLEHLDERLAAIRAAILVLDNDGCVIDRRDAPEAARTGTLLFTSGHRTGRTS